MLLSTTLPYSL